VKHILLRNHRSAADLADSAENKQLFWRISAFISNWEGSNQKSGECKNLQTAKTKRKSNEKRNKKSEIPNKKDKRKTAHFFPKKFTRNLRHIHCPPKLREVEIYIQFSDFKRV
jgi:hypothetical protein